MHYNEQQLAATKWQAAAQRKGSPAYGAPAWDTETLPEEAAGKPQGQAPACTAALCQPLRLSADCRGAAVAAGVACDVRSRGATAAGAANQPDRAKRVKAQHIPNSRPYWWQEMGGFLRMRPSWQH